jgi:hypothetical protein
MEVLQKRNRQAYGVSIISLTKRENKRIRRDPAWLTIVPQEGDVTVVHNRNHVQRVA